MGLFITNSSELMEILGVNQAVASSMANNIARYFDSRKEKLMTTIVVMFKTLALADVIDGETFDSTTIYFMLEDCSSAREFVDELRKLKEYYA